MKYRIGMNKYGKSITACFTHSKDLTRDEAFDFYKTMDNSIDYHVSLENVAMITSCFKIIKEL